ncbi:hypothetical protein PJK45_29035 [Mycobacterium kansasii]|uniref:PE family protein n=1 Tax=Mycobacterium kansasii ATCC 12478 TaxID=557599 RepID=U5WRZ5_MYCKA|nr:hypothetical protein [Mycobacterium kansasii]AGZ50646.1 hypothetical protein MKAN_10375 [Mycobacterium kansasii ATCC 12478]ARG57569.1 hypothetical protein B1T43_18790 [Mycobacterium kansasii]ARG63071.1 hypothetical protein B1T45_19200 [Mycobacterium kansasii]ARG74741.1 hypothetical protein B1T51_09930 [Mycobacterium kansasii]ARG80197.1 hypothetical protein B1T52_09985 [Mycobacterium kansasii]
MERGQLRIDVPQLEGVASQWGQRSLELAVLAPPSLGQPFQRTTAAVRGAHAAVEFAAAALLARTQATASTVQAGATGYASNEATAVAEMAAARPRLV